MLKLWDLYEYQKTVSLTANAVFKMIYPQDFRFYLLS